MEEIELVVASAPQAISGAKNLYELEELESNLVGKRSKLLEIQKGMGSLSPEEKPIVGKALQEARGTIVSLLQRKRAELELAAANSLLKKTGWM